MIDNPRKRAVIMMVLGYGLSAYIWDSTLMEAKLHESSVSLSTVLVMTVTIGFVGMLSLIFGKKLDAHFAGWKKRKRTWKDRFLLLIMLVPGAIAYFILQEEIEKYGYTFM